MPDVLIPMPSLYSISSQLASILASGVDGELPEDAEKQIEDLAMVLPLKIDNILRYCQSLQVQAGGLQAEIDRLRDWQNSIWRQVGRLQEYVHASLLRCDMQAVETEHFRIRIQNSPPAVEVDTAGVDIRQEWPVGFYRERISIEPDRKALLAAWKEGEQLPAGVSVRQGTHLRIK